jgi:hypothetical protein
MEENNVKDVYINGFYIIMRAADAQIQLNLNGQDIVKVNMSLITAKNLALKLNGELTRYEADLDVKIESYEEVQTKIDAFNLRAKQEREELEKLNKKEQTG